jgi:hypothetical protein
VSSQEALWFDYGVYVVVGAGLIAVMIGLWRSR